MKVLAIASLALTIGVASARVFGPAALADSVPPAPAAAPPAATGTPTNSAPADPMRRIRDDRAAFLDARLAALRAGLQLKPDQDTLWAPLEAAIRGLVQRRDVRDAPKADAPGSGVDDLRQRSAWMIHRGEALGKLADAGAPFVASLSEEQKARLPVLLERIGPRRMLERVFGIEGTGRGGDDGRRHEERADRDRGPSDPDGDRGLRDRERHDERHGWGGRDWGGRDRSAQTGRCAARGGFDRERPDRGDGWDGPAHRRHDRNEEDRHMGGDPT